MLVALTGATGAVGSAVARQASAAGHEVRALVRDADRRELPAAWDVVEGSLTDMPALEALCRGADTIVHAAYSATDDPEEFVAANVGATLRLLVLTGGVTERQLVYVSTLGVYGEDPSLLPQAETLPLDESLGLWPRDYYGAHKLAMEKMVIAGSGAPGLCTSAFRLGCVLAPGGFGGRHLGQRLEEARATGGVRTPGGAYVISADDAASVLVEALGDSSTGGRVYNTFDDWLDFADLARPLGEILGRDVSVSCDRSPPPRPALRNDAIRARYPRFRTGVGLVAALRELASS